MLRILSVTHYSANRKAASAYLQRLPFGFAWQYAPLYLPWRQCNVMSDITVNARRCPGVGRMLDQHRRHLANILPTLGEFFAFAVVVLGVLLVTCLVCITCHVEI